MNNVVVSKIRVYNPNKKSSKHANKGFLKYIATRPGVDITEIDLANKVENLYLDMSDDKKYLEYITYRPKSHGLFGNVDTTYVDQVANDMYSLTKDGNIIYRGIVSLCEEDARELGYLDKNKWNTLLRATMPDVSNTLGISISTMKWVAAFHNEEGHPHVHYMLWDSRKRVVSPYIHVAKQQRCREIFSKEIFQDERINLVIEKTVERDDIIKLAKNITKDGQEYLLNFQSIETIPQKIPKKIDINESEEIATKLERLVELLPEHGRINYAFVPKEVKAYTDEIVDMIFKRKDVSKELNSFLKHNEKISQTYSALDEKVQRATSKAYLDIERRIQNVVLNAAKELRFSNYKKADNIGSILNENKSYNKITKDEDITLIESEKGIQLIEENLQTNTYSKLTYENDNVKQARAIINNVYSKKEDYRKALKLFSIEASKGNIVALTDIGKMYAQGLGVRKDIKIAGSFMRRARQSFLYQEEKESIVPSIEGDVDEYNEASTRINHDSKLNNNNSSNDMRVTERLQVASANSGESNHHVKNTSSSDKSDGSNKSNKEDKKFSLWTDNYKNARLYLYGDKENKPNVKMAIELLLTECESGNPLAYYDMGAIYSKGLKVEIDTEKAKDYYTKSFNIFNDLESQYSNNYLKYKIGKMYMQGIGTEQNYEEAFNWLAEPVANGYQLAEYTLGNLYYNGNGVEKDMDKAFTLYKSSASKGNVYAKYELGKMYEKGVGTSIDLELSEKNYKEALESFVKSEDERPDDNLQYRIAKMYYDGKGTNTDTEKAIVYLKKAVELKNENAQYLLAKINLKSENSEEKEESLSWFKEAAESGNERAQYYLGKLYLDKEYGIYNEDEGIRLLKLSAESNNTFAQFTLGKSLLDKESKYFDIEQGISYLLLSAESENEFAQYTLGKVYLSDEYGCKDIEKAMYYLNLSADQGNSFAQYTLGKVYLTDEYKTKDINKAIEYLNMSADQDNEYAQYTLGKIYISEEYNCKDINKGIEYLLKSAAHGNSFAQYTLGKIYIDKEANLFNMEKGIEYLELSEQQGNEYAQYTLGKLYLDKDSPYFNEKLGLDYLKKATDQNNVYAIYTLGKIYMDENYKCYNEEQGMEYIEHAAKLDFDCAQYALGKICMDKESKYFDEDKAFYWLSKSADANDYSKYSLARLLLRDDGKHYDPNKATTLLYEAANNNNSYAQLELAKQFLYGKHVKKDKEKAEYWLNKSLEDNNPAAQEFVTYRKEFEERMFKQKLMSSSYNLIQSCFNTVNANKEIAKFELDQEILRASRKNAKKMSHHKENEN